MTLNHCGIIFLEPNLVSQQFGSSFSILISHWLIVFCSSPPPLPSPPKPSRSRVACLQPIAYLVTISSMVLLIYLVLSQFTIHCPTAGFFQMSHGGGRPQCCLFTFSSVVMCHVFQYTPSVVLCMLPKTSLMCRSMDPCNSG